MKGMSCHMETFRDVHKICAVAVADMDADIARTLVLVGRAKLFLDERVAHAAKHTQVTDIRLALPHALIWCQAAVSFVGRAVVEVGGSGHGVAPESGLEAAVKEHATAVVLECPVHALDTRIMLGRIWWRMYHADTFVEALFEERTAELTLCHSRR